MFQGNDAFTQGTAPYLTIPLVIISIASEIDPKFAPRIKGLHAPQAGFGDASFTGLLLEVFCKAFSISLSLDSDVAVVCTASSVLVEYSLYLYSLYSLVFRY